MGLFDAFRSRPTKKDVASGFVGGSFGAVESTLDAILKEMSRMERPRPQAGAVMEVRFILLGLAYNLIDRAVFAELSPPHRSELLTSTCIGWAWLSRKCSPNRPPTGAR
jgi:hypothetical protein